MLACCACAANLTIPLAVVPAGPDAPGTELDFRKTGPSEWQAPVPENAVVTLRAAEGGGYLASLADERPQLLEAGAAIPFSLGGKPFRLFYRRRANGNEEFLWQTAWHWSGAIRIGACPVPAVLAPDGRLTLAGAPVPVRGPVILCGAAYLVRRAAEDAIELSPSDLPVPRLGDVLESGDLPAPRQGGRFLLIDFWASWCAPCLAAFPRMERLLQSYSGRLEILGVNVDDPDRVAEARKLAADRRLRWPILYHGFGDYEPLWRALAAQSGGPLELPFYALLDPAGRLLFAGDAAHLETALQRIPAAAPPQNPSHTQAGN